MIRGIAAVALLVMCPWTGAQDFPVKPVRIIVGNPPGGTADLVARQLAKHLTGVWRQSVIVDNRVGASGIIGTDLVPHA